MNRNISAVFGRILIFCMLFTVPAFAHDNHGPHEKKIFTKHFDRTLFNITEHAAFSVEILLDDSEYPIGKGVVGIVLHNAKDSDVKGARITLALKNMETGQSVPGAPTITDKGNGLYIVSGLNLRRQGRWELAVTVSKDNVEDSVRFDLPAALMKLYPKGRYSP
jgi:hypothetical protein